MKKVILILSAWLILPAAFGQSTTTTTTITTTTSSPVEGIAQTGSDDDDERRREFRRGYIGARALASFASFDVRTIDNNVVVADIILGYGGGAVVGVNLSPHFALQAEILYSELAQKYKDDNGISRNLKLNYINVPLLVLVNSNVTKPVNLNIGAGPQIGINTGSSVKTEAVNESDMTDTVHAALAVKSGDIGIAYGAGLDFLLSPALKFSIGYRGVRGLVDISDDSNTTTTKDYYILDRAHVNTHSAYAGLSVCF
jgi:hypothetical protein